MNKKEIIKKKLIRRLLIDIPSHVADTHTHSLWRQLTFYELNFLFGRK